MVIAGDTSFLLFIYGNDVHSPGALAWLRTATAALNLNGLTHDEFGNALRFAEFRKAIKPGEAAQIWARFEAAVAQGRLIVQTSNLADVVDVAKRLSATHTLTGGHSGFDILHVATAIEIGASQFLTFDENQKTLAEAEGLVVPV